MKETEWTFKIPNVLKEAVKQNEVHFQISYRNVNGEIAKGLKITRNISLFSKYIELNDISEKELEKQIGKFIYGER